MNIEPTPQPVEVVEVSGFSRAFDRDLEPQRQSSGGSVA
jgi:hypothetical protein